MPVHSSLILAVMLISTAGPAAAQIFCDDPPELTVLTGVDISPSGLSSEGHPVAYSWYITPPQAPVPTEPTSTGPMVTFAPDLPGLWSVALVTDYEHGAIGGGLWSSDTCVTVQAASVVAAIDLSSTQIATDEDLQLSGESSQWAVGVVPLVEWQVDGQALGTCNGGPPPATPADLDCTVPANWLPPGWHTAGLRLTDPSSGDTSLATGDFEVIEIVPLSVDFGWTPAEPDPGQWVHFVASATPQMPEEDFTRVTWDQGDGTVIVYTSCPLLYGSCLESPHSYSTDGWYDVTITVETATETASQTHSVKIGDPVTPPQATFTLLPSSPMLLEVASFTFDGSCEGQCSWLWDFGDGSQSTAQNPTHAWEIPSTYSVTLTVANQGGSDFNSLNVGVSSCWPPASPVQAGTCYGGPVSLTAAAGSAWSWSTGATSQAISAPLAGSYWVNIDNGSNCWGHSPSTVVLNNCGDPGGDTNLDSQIDTSDVSALIPELTDGDGDAVVGAGGGDLTAPGGDVTGDFRLRSDDLLTVLVELYR